MPVWAYDGSSRGMPSREALRVATNAMRSRYVLPETFQHHEVKSEFLRLAYLIQAYGLTSTAPASRRDRSEKLANGTPHHRLPRPVRRVPRQSLTVAELPRMSLRPGLPSHA